MFQRRPDPAANDVELSAATRGLSWAAIVANVVLVITMIRMGSRLDAAGPFLQMITLGGHHRVVLVLAAAALLLLGMLAPATGGFVRAGALQQVLLPVAGVLSLVALAGALALAGIGLVVIAIAVLLFRPYPRARIDVTQRRR